MNPEANDNFEKEWELEESSPSVTRKPFDLNKKEDDEDLLLTAYDLAKVKEHSDELRLQRNYINEQFVDTFYKKIPDDRKRELTEEITKKRKLVTESEMRAFRCEDVMNEYQVKNQHFQDTYLFTEEKRKVAFEQLKDLHIMKDYLIDLSASAHKEYQEQGIDLD